MKSRELNTVFADNYAEKVRSSQRELYDEIERIINNEIDIFISKKGRKPVLFDIGSAGLYLYNTKNIEKVTILDIFPKPDNVKLTDNTEWIVGNILSDDINTALPGRKYDIVIMASLLHHLCDAKNNINKNLRTCFANIKSVLKDAGKIYIFESTCPQLFTKLQDFLYPVYSYILTRILKFTYVRMTSLKEILASFKSNGYLVSIIAFKQPKFVALLFKKTPISLTPLKIHSIVAYLKEL